MSVQAQSERAQRAGKKQAERPNAFPETEDAPFPNGKFQTRIGEFEFSNDYPTAASVQKLFDDMDFQRACQAYIWALPLVSFADWKNEWRKQGAGNFNILVMQSFDQKHGLITPNMTTPVLHRIHGSQRDGTAGGRSSSRRNRRRRP